MNVLWSLSPPYHESLYDAKVVMDDLGQGGQAVGGAGGIAEKGEAGQGQTDPLQEAPANLTSLPLPSSPDNLHGVVILVMVHTHHKHGGIRRRGRDDDPLGSTLQVSLQQRKS